ncbi:hypothetical protein BJ875DRAFT_442308 [Amylocarpus encephaloides]|uniref:Rhodopsin domain-containing protein n=1 Tax=Amylocarpus encephaloides TaxID=45428 RepID=A0A9P8C5U3_9HELO|nr:hypothetical protein BJ875DRAFT_442308 [Amylocarpus encephaloides]
MPNQDNTPLVAVPGLGADDWAILGSLIFASAVSILMLAPCQFGFGKHVKSLSKSNRLMALKPLSVCMELLQQPRHFSNVINWYGNAGFSIITDVLILVLPMTMVYKLKLPAPQRLALAMVFALGGFILRMTTLNLSTTSPDITFPKLRVEHSDFRDKEWKTPGGMAVPTTDSFQRHPAGENGEE